MCVCVSLCEPQKASQSNRHVLVRVVLCVCVCVFLRVFVFGRVCKGVGVGVCEPVNVESEQQLCVCH